MVVVIGEDPDGELVCSFDVVGRGVEGEMVDGVAVGRPGPEGMVAGVGRKEPLISPIPRKKSSCVRFTCQWPSGMPNEK